MEAAAKKTNMLLTSTPFHAFFPFYFLFFSRPLELAVQTSKAYY